MCGRQQSSAASAARGGQINEHVKQECDKFLGKLLLFDKYRINFGGENINK